MRVDRFLFVCIATAVTLAACGSGTDPFAGRTRWDDVATQRLDQLRASVAGARPGECTELALNDFATSVQAARALKLRHVPKAQGTCELRDGETVEFAAFRDAAARQRSNVERTEAFCRVARNPKGDRLPVKGFPGLRFVVGDDWSVQVDTQHRGLEFAEILGGAYAGMPCEGDVSDWEAEPLTKLMTKLRALPAQDCPRPTVDDHEAARIQQYRKLPLPAASVSCDAHGAKVHAMWFGSSIPDPNAYLAKVASYFCVAGMKNYIMMGDGWGGVVFDTSDALPTRVATSFGLELDEFACTNARRTASSTTLGSP